MKKSIVITACILLQSFAFSGCYSDMIDYNETGVKHGTRIWYLAPQGGRYFVEIYGKRYDHNLMAYPPYYVQTELGKLVVTYDESGDTYRISLNFFNGKKVDVWGPYNLEFGMGLNAPEHLADHIRMDSQYIYLTTHYTGKTHRIDRETRLMTESPKTQP